MIARSVPTDYRNQAAALLPYGPAWPRDEDAILMKLLLSLADEMSRTHNRAVDLIDEAIPKTTLELLSDWEATAGLPDECSDEANTLEERRNLLVGRLTETGSQSRQHFIDIAAAVGFIVTIEEFRPFTVETEIEEPIYEEEWRFVWRVRAPEETIREFVVDSGCDEPLRDWGNDTLECVISRIAPAHTKVLFAYGEA